MRTVALKYKRQNTDQQSCQSQKCTQKLNIPRNLSPSREYLTRFI